MKPALLIIDIQNRFFTRNGVTAESLNNAAEYINAAIALFRERHLPIIAVQHKNEATGLVPGVPEFDIPESIKLEVSDINIIKTYGDAFNKTILAAQLHSLDIDSVIITGFCAEFCINATCIGAENNDFVPIVLKGALASGHPERIALIEEINDIISLGALKAALKPAE
ncbi:Hydrolase (Isochorismatase family) [Candidatus Zixiibacteriota bacterium]|nr:Hydrolase (Isochorismatase family) [candidate division Zixibacteria bacterium]